MLAAYGRAYWDARAWIRGVASFRSMKTNSQGSISEGQGFYIPSLDGMRALAFLIVFLAHAGLERWIPGYFGLSVFFFLSGYLITTLLRREYDKTGGICLRSFYLRRGFRILPNFYLVLMFMTALTKLGLIQGPPHLQGLAYQIFHLSNYYIISHGWWDGIAPGTGVYWSLAVEEHFYLLFPILYLALRRYTASSSHQVWVLAAICGMVLIWRCILVFVLNMPKDRLYVATDARIDSILFGCALAVQGNPVLDKGVISDTDLKRFWFPAGLLLLLVSILMRGEDYSQTLRYTLQGLGLIPVFVTVVRHPDWGVIRWLNLPVLRAIGMLSYSLYLLHTGILVVFQQRTELPPLLQGLGAFGVCILLSAAIHYSVEKPLSRLRKRLESGWSTSPRRAQGVGRITVVEPDDPLALRNGDAT